MAPSSKNAIKIEYDGYVFTKDKKTGYYLSAKPINDGKRIRLHVYVWTKHHGEPPKGYSIHHIDHDKDNNDISNLQLVTKGKHNEMHMEVRVKTEYEEMRERFITNAHPKATEWHKSKEGREWHKEHWEASIGKHMKVKVKKECIVCGSEYEVNKINAPKSKYCSKKCKAKYRRDNKLDHITKKCIICGNDFFSGKYDTVKVCSMECKGKSISKTKKGD